MTSLMKKSVLIVDDYENWREFLTELIEDEYDVTTVGSFEEAQQALRQQTPPFHVAVMDVRLRDWEVKDKGGLDLYRQEIKTTGKYTNVIIVTGYHSEDTKQIVDLLDAYAYLLKFPPEGEFNRADYKRLVRSAADNAEKRRTEKSRVLILEKQEALQKTLSKQLTREGYEIVSVNRLEDVTERQSYGLILINAEYLVEQNILSKIKRQNPSAKIILITTPEIVEIIRTFRKRDIDTVVAAQNGEINCQELKESIRRCFAAEATKYWMVKIDESEQPWGVGKNYTIQLIIQNQYESKSSPIWLPPQQVQMLLTVTIDASDMKIESGTKIFWKVFPDKLPITLSFTLTPTVTGRQTLSIDLDHPLFHLGRITKEIEVIEREHV